MCGLPYLSLEKHDNYFTNNMSLSLVMAFSEVMTSFDEKQSTKSSPPGCIGLGFIALQSHLSLTGRWPMREETLSDTYMMFPSVVRAIRKPSNACHNTKKCHYESEEILIIYWWQCSFCYLRNSLSNNENSISIESSVIIQWMTELNFEYWSWPHTT